MSTKAQLKANRENAQKSTGPRTEEGKQTSSRNAFRHGLSGRLTYLSDEDQLLYAAHCERLIREMEPVTLIEEELVKTIADSQWQINRCRAFDQQIRLELMAQADGLTEAQAVRQDLEGHETLDKLARYQTRHTRALHQAIREFDVQKQARLAANRATAIESYEESSGSLFNPKWHRVATPTGFDLQKCPTFQGLQKLRAEIIDRFTHPHAVPEPPLASAAA